MEILFIVSVTLGPITNLNICSTCISQVEGVYMDLIKVRVHHEANLWQAQRNLVGTGKCRWIDDPRWFPTTLRYHLLELKAQEGHLVLAHKPNTFYSFMGLCSSWWCFLFLGCKWSEWDSCPFHHRDLNTYATSSHVPIQSQRAYFYGCHIWHQQCEIPFIHINGVFIFIAQKLINVWRLGGMVECLASKLFLHMPNWRPSCFIVDDAPQELWALW